MMYLPTNENAVTIAGIVQPGRQIASGIKIKTIGSIIHDFDPQIDPNTSTSFIHYSGPIGTLEPQIYLFDTLLTKQYASAYEACPLKTLNCFPGTINVNIAPYQFEIKDGFKLTNVLWRKEDPQRCETFWLIPGQISVKQKRYHCYFYLPDPTEKLKEHQTGPSTMEILTQKIPEMVGGRSYGKKVSLYFSPKYIQFTEQNNMQNNRQIAPQ